MDYVHGFHLGRWASFVQQAHQRPDGGPGQLPWQLAVHICVQVLDALEYAHTLKGDGQPLYIVHRDVSPSNVLLDIEGRVLLADFGIAKSNAEEETRTITGTVKGKFSYMAPEILEGHPPEPSADVYATAVLLHSLAATSSVRRSPAPPSSACCTTRRAASTSSAPTFRPRSPTWWPGPSSSVPRSASRPPQSFGPDVGARSFRIPITVRAE
ncbi:MAG: hypothetical protein OHK0013_40610 [Sandaracinaceae bacterium]